MERELRRRERNARLALWLVDRSSRNRTLLDRLCRVLIERAMKRPHENDFMRDPLIDNDRGFDPDELDRYQNGSHSRFSSGETGHQDELGPSPGCTAREGRRGQVE